MCPAFYVVQVGYGGRLAEDNLDLAGHAQDTVMTKVCDAIAP